MQRQAEKRRGNITVLVAISMMAIFGVVAIAMEGGLLFDNHRRVQSAADAAALAAAVDLFSNYGANGGLDPSGTAQASALSTAAANGFNNDGVNSVVTVNIPPKSGNFVGKAGYAEVIVQFNQKRYFSSLFGSGTLPGQARAVACGKTGNIGILILSTQLTVAAQICNTVNIQNGGQIYCNSNSSVLNSEFSSDGYVGGVFLDSTNKGGDPSLTCGGINVVASSHVTPYNINSGTVTSDVTFTNNGGINQSGGPWADPLASVAEPTMAGLTNRGSVTVTTNTTLQPGVYNSITIGSTGKNGTAPTVTLAPGLYYLTESGGVTLNAGTLQGTGVMFFLDWVSTDNFLKKSAGLVNITPPTATSGGTWPTGTSSSTYNGISLWLTRDSTKEVHVESTYNLTMSGTWYAAGWGGSGTSVGGEFDIRPDGSTTVFNIGNYICNQAEWGQGYNNSQNKSNGIININPTTAVPNLRPTLVE